MPDVARTILPVQNFAPARALSDRFAGWVFQILDPDLDRDALLEQLDPDNAVAVPADFEELFLPRKRRVVLNRNVYELDPDFAQAHAVCHLSLHHVDTGEPFSDDECDEASTVARLWLRKELSVLPESLF
jgi:hypothetical protein